MRKRLVVPIVAVGVASTFVAGSLMQRQTEAVPVPVSSESATNEAPAGRGEATGTIGVVPPSLAASPSTAASTPASPSPSRTSSSPKPSASAAAATQVNASTVNHTQGEAEQPGWKIDYFDGFDDPITSTDWERYGWGDPAVGHGAMGVMSQRNSFTRDGKLIIRTQYQDGQWSAGGAGSRHIFSASYGRWEVRAKFPEAKGIGYAFLLWPEDQSWPPEIDFAEGRVNGPEIMGVYHWDPDNKQEHRFFDQPDMSGWHTYGVIVEPTKITFTFDGKPWGEIEHPNVTDKRMWIGFQTGAMDPNGWQNDTETVDNGVPGPLTPAVADIEIDYVAHYVAQG